VGTTDAFSHPRFVHGAMCLTEVVIRLMNHASEMMHKIYQRERVKDVMQWCTEVKFPQIVTFALN